MTSDESTVVVGDPAGTIAGSVVIAMATFRRAADLTATLASLAPELAAAAAAGVRAEVLVVDNDPEGSAADVVAAAASGVLAGSAPVRYVVESEPGIAAARNKALDEVANSGDVDDPDVLIFIDDDEYPRPGWLAAMLATHAESGATAVSGAVVSEYDTDLEPWVAAGRFFDRRRLPTGTSIDVAATNNLLLDLARLRPTGLRFDARFGLTGGSDTLFTRQLTGLGHRMVWCDEAVVVDRVPAARTTREWVLRRAYRSGNTASRVDVLLASSGPRRLVVRSRHIARGLARVAAGWLRSAFGVVTGSLEHRVRGRRAVSRGNGMIAGAYGSYYTEYAREPAGQPLPSAR